MNQFRLPGLCLVLSLLLVACSGSSSQTSNSQLGGAIQGTQLSLSQTVTTIAGPSPSVDGTGTEARFLDPQGITTDGMNLYVADTLNHTIRKVVIATGVVTTLAGSPESWGATDGTGAAARFWEPRGITTDGTSLFVTDSRNGTIRKVVIATGEVTTLAGSAGSWGAADGTGSAATFSNLQGIATNGTDLFVADSGNNTIRKVVITTGEVTTLAGSVGNWGAADGSGTAASFASPQGITTDGTNLFVADSGNSMLRRVVIATGQVTTLAGEARSWGTADGIGAVARFAFPQGITTDGSNLFVADSGNNTVRKVVIATGEVTTVAGSAGSWGSADGSGTTASFASPQGITTDGTNLFVADSGNSTIRKVVTATGAVTTLAGNARNWGAADGTGAKARFSFPTAITTDGTSLFVADSNNGTIRKLVIATGAVTTLAGSAGNWGAADGTGTKATFSNPYGVTTDGTSLFVADSGSSTIRKVVIATGEVTTLAGAAWNPGATDGTGAAARFAYPCGITTDGTYLFVTDAGNGTIRKVVIATGQVTTLAGTAGISGWADGTAEKARFSFPQGITTDGTYLFVVDAGQGTIRKVIIATAQVTTLAGSPGGWGVADGTGGTARFSNPQGITTDGINLYVADSSNNMIRKVTIATGVVTTVAGSPWNRGAADGTGGAASFSDPRGITTDGTHLFVTDAGNNTIRRIR